MIHPHIPVPASSPEDDPTGVRALLASLPEPDPMPDYLVERINASLAAEQTQRVAGSHSATVSPSGASVTPLLAPTRRRPGRILIAIAGAAAAVALIGVVSSNLLKTNPTTTASDSAAAAITSSSGQAGSEAAPSANDKAAAGGPSTAPLVQIRRSGTRYTKTDFVTQAATLRTKRAAELDSSQPGAAESPGLGTFGTTLGLTDCLGAIGAGGAQMVNADLAFYEGVPAVIIVATTDGLPTAYVVGRDCSRADAALLRPATLLP